MTKEELKQKILKVFKVFNGREETIFDICWKEIAELEERIDRKEKKLARAKEIIKEFVAWGNWEGANCPNFKDIQSKAEQFLKEIEK